MVSLATVKTLLKKTNTSDDAFILAMIPIVYSTMIDYCNNLFSSSDFVIESDEIYFDNGATNTINLAAGGFAAVGFPTGKNLIISGSRLNDGIVTLSSQTDAALTVSETMADETQTTAGYSVKVALANFPQALEFIAARMIGYQLTNAGSAGITSQSIGSYSESRASGSVGSGYPNEILAMLGPYKNMRTGRGTIQWHVNENRRYFPQEPSLLGYGY